MVNFNGAILDADSNFFNENNRGLQFGDILFEEVRVINGKPIFWEEHYFRLMASMRIMRMEIPMEFTMELLENEILKTLDSNGLLNKSAVVTFGVYRDFNPTHLSVPKNVSWFVSCRALESPFYTLDDKAYEVELFKDFLINQDMLSNLNTNNRAVEVVANIFAKENGYADAILINSTKHVVGTTRGPIFLVKDGELKTPPLSQGVKNDVTRKKLLEIAEKIDQITIVDDVISPFELQKADELFIVNVVEGIIPITKYRKKEYGMEMAKNLLGKLNANARLANLK